MNESRQLAIVIPALNESASIAKVITAVNGYGTPVVVDDGSSDDTAAIARACGAQVVSHGLNRGYDAALDSGFRRAFELGFQYVITMDADGQHTPDLIQDIMRELELGADVVVGVRDKKQRFAEHVFALVARALWKIQDPLCGMKGYRMTVYAKRGHFDSFGSIGTELALFAVRNHYQIAQLSIKTRERDGEPRFGKAVSANFRIFRALLLSLWFTRALPSHG